MGLKLILMNYGFCRNLGGIERFLYEISNEYVKQGLDVSIFTKLTGNIYNLKNNRIKLVVHGVPDLKKHLLFIKPLTLSLYIKKIAKNLPFHDIVIARHPYYTFAMSYLKNYKQLIYVPALCYPRYQFMIANFKEKFWATVWYLQYYFIELRALQAAHKICVLSYKKRNEIKKFYKLKKEVNVVYPGVDTEHFKPDSTKKADTFTFLYAGRFSKEKRLDFLIKAFKAISKNSKLILLGEGNEKIKLQTLALRLNLIKEIEFLEATHTPAKVYPRADVICLPSKYEGFGHVVLEAMACGLVPIVYHTAGVAEIIKNKVGFVCKNNKEFICAMKKLNNKKVAINELSNKARETALKYSWEKTAKKIIDFS